MTQENNGFKKIATLSVLGFWGYVKYQNFKNYINKVRFGISVQKIVGNQVLFYLSTLNTLGVNYKIKSIVFATDDKIIGGIVGDDELQQKIVKNSRIPLQIVFFTPVTKEELENCKIIVYYRFASISFSREYQLTPVLLNDSNPITIDVTDTSSNSNNYTTPCGCGGKN